MDGLTLCGIILAAVAIIGGQHLEGGEFSTLINGPAFLIVVGGTVAAVLIQTNRKVFFRFLRIMFWVFFPPKRDYERKIKSMIDYTNIVRNSGAIGLEGVLEYEKDPILNEGLQFVADGTDAEYIRHTLEIQSESEYKRDLAASRVFESMGGYSPTIGIIGAVLGLIQVMSNLSEPENLGHGIAIAFVATLYGIGAANIFYIPCYKKLKHIIDIRARYHEMLVEGIVEISLGAHPRLLESKLRSFISE